MKSDPAISERAATDYGVLLPRYAWEKISANLDEYGAATLPGLLSTDECQAMIGLLADPEVRSTPVLPEQGAWGDGDNRYFRNPLPAQIGSLRHALYPYLVPIAHRWNERMEVAERFPATLTDFTTTCHRHRQILPMSMLFDHGVGHQSLLHQDICGRHVFPLQVVILLSKPDVDFAGGEFVLAEQRPRMQTRPEVVSLNQGDAVVFAVANRPVTGTRGTYRVNLRHGFSKVRRGRQRALSIVFHDATY